MLSLNFLITCLIVVLIPGTGVIFTVSTGLTAGKRASVFAALGCTAGIVPHLLASVLGLSALLHTSALAFEALKYAGAAYLLYLAYATWRDRSAFAMNDTPTIASARSLMVRGLLLNILNPKLTIFFLAFLPQFIHPESGSSLAQFAVLGLIFSGLSAVYTTLISVSIRPLSKWMTGLSKLRRWEGKIIGTLFMGLGLKIAFQQR